jgi:hypothetical protein
VNLFTFSECTNIIIVILLVLLLLLFTVFFKFPYRPQARTVGSSVWFHSNFQQNFDSIIKILGLLNTH